MNAVAAANLVGITDTARRLMLDGALDTAIAERKPVAAWLHEKKPA